MEYLYNAYTKLVNDKLHYFVKKFMTFPELPGVADVQAGFGMHTDFEKACILCGIDDRICRKQILLELEQRNQSGLPHWLPIVRQDEPKKPRKKAIVQITGIANRWLAERGAEALN